MRASRVLLLLGAALLPASAVDEIAALEPSLLPVDAARISPFILQMRFSPPSSGIVAYSLTYEDPSGASQTLLANLSSSIEGLYKAGIPASSTAGFATIVATSGIRKEGILFYDKPTFRPITAAVTSAGLSTVTIESLGVLPSLNPMVRVTCGGSFGGDRDGFASLSPDGSVSQTDNMRPGVFDYLASGTVTSDGKNVSFLIQPVPPECVNASVEVTFNSGYHYHLAGYLAISRFNPIPVVSLYPYKLADSPWVRAHQAARIEAGSTFQSAIRADLYYEESWRLPALPTGTLVDSDFFENAIQNKSAKLMLMAGTQYLTTAIAKAQKYPHVNFLLMSTLLATNIPAAPNIAFATGRMFEGAYLAGIIAGSMTKTGAIGMLLALNHSGSFAMMNAFHLGALRAIDQGLNSNNVARTSLVTRAWIIGAFSDVWAEKNAALDLLQANTVTGDPAVDVLLPVTDNDDPQLACHEVTGNGCYSIGFNGDERKSLGDKVLISLIYTLVPMYQQFIRKVVEGKPFGPETWIQGVGKGVDITTMSPAVPVAAQREVNAVASLMRSLPQSQEMVFCTQGQYLATDNTVLFDGTNPLNGRYPNVTMGGLTPNADMPCLPRSVSDYRSFALKGTRLHGLYVPPKKPNNTPPVPEFYQPTGGIYALCCILGGILIALCIAAFVGVWKFKKSPSIMYASPFFLSIMLLGGVGYGALMFADPFEAVPTLENAACAAQLWASGISFVLLYGSLFAKTWRISSIFRSLKRVKITLKHTLRVLAILMLIELVTLGIIQGVFPPGVVTNTLPAGGAYPTGLTFQRCGAMPSNPISGAQGVDGHILLDVVHVLFLFWGAYLAWQTRSVPSGFNESKWIFGAIAIELVFGIFQLALSTAENTAPSTTFVVDALRWGISIILSLSLLFASKFYSIYKKWADLTTERDAKTGEYVLQPSSFGLRLLPKDTTASTSTDSGDNKVVMGVVSGGQQQTSLTSGATTGSAAGGSLLSIGLSGGGSSTGTGFESGVAFGKPLPPPSASASAVRLVSGGSTVGGTSHEGSSVFRSVSDGGGDNLNPSGSVGGGSIDNYASSANLLQASQQQQLRSQEGSGTTIGAAGSPRSTSPLMQGSPGPALVGGTSQSGGACLPSSGGSSMKSASVAPA
jgi:basic membrane protein A and related proteins